MANELAIVVDEEQEQRKSTQDKRDSMLSSWIMEKVNDWESYRDTNFKEKWDEFYRLWRGIWAPADKSRDSERSRLIAPALQQAIEASVAELEEATFGRGRWFDVSDDIPDPEKGDMTQFRNLLMEDLNEHGVPAAVSEVFLNAALYGTGVGKIYVEEVVERQISSVGEEPVAEESVASKVGLVSVQPQEFAIDPAARTIDEALGMAHVTFVPRHTVTMKQQEGIYKPGEVGTSPDDTDISGTGERSTGLLADKVKIIEYHGLVPKDLMPVELEEGEEIVDLGFSDNDKLLTDETELVEAIVTIANDGIVLKAVENPLFMKDRAFVAFPYDIVPNRFWGRGVAEKGYNPQKALDAELRGRIDAMALSIHPMMAVDASRLPRGGNLAVKPGRTILTNGDPNQILRPLNFGQVNPTTFSQSGELERMIQMGTGAMDSATPVGISPRNSTASGMSMIMSGAIKRSKRTLANIERLFTKPLIHKAAWRYMQFAPERYKTKDVKFVVHSTLGIMARELEQQQLTGLLSTVPADSPAFWMLIRSIYDNSSISTKEQMLLIIDQMLQKSLNPPPPPVDPMITLKEQEMNFKYKSDQDRVAVELLRARAEVARIEIEVLKAPDEMAKKQAEAMLALAKAEAEELGAQLNFYREQADSLVDKSEERLNGRANR